MSRGGITPADVVRACVALRKQRRQMGVRNVRQELGRGSYRTIGRHLKLLAFRDVGERR
jgi:hypothetical protein